MLVPLILAIVAALHDVQRSAVEVDTGTSEHGVGMRSAFSSWLAPSTHYARPRWTENRASTLFRYFAMNSGTLRPEDIMA